MPCGIVLKVTREAYAHLTGNVSYQILTISNFAYHIDVVDMYSYLFIIGRMYLLRGFIKWGFILGKSH